MNTRSLQRYHPQSFEIQNIAAGPNGEVGRGVLTAALCARTATGAVRIPRPTYPKHSSGYLLIECLVYILVLFILLGVSYSALFHCISNSVALRRNAEDISKALHIGEVWRADIRSTTGKIRFQETNLVEVLYLPNSHGQTVYCFATNTISRSYNGGPWSQLLTNVASSTMAFDRRKSVMAWYWNLKLRTGKNNPHVTPLFTFMSVPETVTAK